MIEKFKNFVSEYWLHIIFLISITAVFGSLYYSEIEKLVPCTFCWWSRIWMYPIAVISTVAVLKKDFTIKPYIAALSVLGTLFASYHVLLQNSPFLQEHETCSAGSISCATPTIAFSLGSISFSLEFFALVAQVTILGLIILKTLIDRKKK